MKKKSYVCIAAAVAALTFSACGDDNKPSSNGGDESVVKQVNRVDDLGGCNKNKFGEIIYVIETDSLYECTGKGWVATDSSAIEGLLSESSSSESDDDDSSDSKSSSSFKTDSSDVADVETVKVDSVTLKGFAQKGPFASGTAVTVYGLDSLLEKTKTKFTGKVAGDSGAFKVENIVLPSQFALVEVSGFFKSEVSGKNTSGTKTTLSAIVDLSEGKSVTANVNLFTTLEYARIKQLVAKDGFNVPAAKKRATTELLAFFGAKGEDLTATSISLDTTAAGEALLTASVMLVSDLSASKFGSRLSDVIDLFAESGIVADEELLVSIADWASKVDSTDNFESIRKNVKEMKLFESVPDFDGYIYKFWTSEYKLGACTDSLEETIKKNDNKKSDNYGAGYACTSKRWHKSTALDTDLGLCTAKREGNFEERKLEKSSEYYVCRSGTWNKITETQFELKECTEKRENEYVMTTDSSYFVCSGKQWTELDAITYELKLCTKDRKDTYSKSKSGKYFVCSDENWEEVDSLSYILETLCTKDNDEKFTKSKEFGNFICLWDNKGGVWREANEIELEMDGICGGKKFEANTIYKSNTGNFYLCSGSEWVDSDKESYELQNIGKCTKERQYEVAATESLGDYACEWNGSKGVWRKASALESSFGVCNIAKNDSAIAGSSSEKCYGCIDSEWNDIDNLACTVGTMCKASLDSTFKNGYTCVHTSAKGYYWRKQTTGESATGKICNTNLLYTFNNGYACDSVSGALNWRAQTAEEKVTNIVCRRASGIDSTFVNGYACVNTPEKGYYWRKQTATEKTTGKICCARIAYELNNGYACDNSTGSYEWRTQTTEEKATGLVCHRGRTNGHRVDSVITEGYVCLENASTGNFYWRTADAGEMATGLMCKSSNLHNLNNKYVCDYTDHYAWREADRTEALLNKVCYSNAPDYTLYGDDIYRCKTSSELSNHAWTKLTSTYTDNRSDAYLVEKNITYRYVTIGDSSFMIDNLRYRHSNDSLSCWRCYNNWGSACKDLGVLYTWTCAMALGTNPFSSLASNIIQQGACPSGWHIPNADETSWMIAQMNELKNYMPADSGHFESGASLQQYQYPKQSGYWTARLYNNTTAYTIHWASTGKAYTTYTGDIKDGFYLRCFRD